MEQLKRRQQVVLGTIVETYIKTVSPVGSRTIAKRFHDEFSPATIRSEMHGLEALAYITHPHTSAGRIPTDKGYRYYVDYLMLEPRIEPRHVEFIEREFLRRMDNVETLIERASRILSTLSEQAGIVAFPSFEELVLRRIELTPLNRHDLLIVWVTDNGFIQDRVIDMKEEISERDLVRLHRFLNEELKGMFLSEIKSYLTQKLERTHDSLHKLYETARTIVFNGFPKTSPRRLHVEGSHHILEQPEFQDWEKSRQLFKALEEKVSLVDVIELEPKHSGVQIHIGVEHNCEDIWDCSFVTSQYFVHQRPVGAVCILGPRRMPYSRVVALVGYMAHRLGEVLEQW